MTILETCAITGHRFQGLPFPGEDAAPECTALRDAIRQEFITLIETRGVRTFLCGMALGTDQICAELVLELKRSHPQLALCAYVPCPLQDAHWRAPQSARWQALLRRAEEIVCVSETYTRDCMLRRNRAMVDHADFLFAVYDDRARGGTAATVRYARTLSKPRLLLHPNTLHLLREDFPD